MLSHTSLYSWFSWTPNVSFWITLSVELDNEATVTTNSPFLANYFSQVFTCLTHKNILTWDNTFIHQCLSRNASNCLFFNFTRFLFNCGSITRVRKWFFILSICQVLFRCTFFILLSVAHNFFMRSHLVSSRRTIFSLLG